MDFMEIFEMIQPYIGPVVAIAAYLIFRAHKKGEGKELALMFLKDVIKNARQYALAGLREDPQDFREWVMGWYDALPDSVSRWVSVHDWGEVVDWGIEHMEDWLEE